jgi:hypothetical protein
VLNLERVTIGAKLWLSTHPWSGQVAASCGIKPQAQVKADTRSAPRVRRSEHGPEQRGRTDLPERNAGYPDKGPS